MNNTTINIYVKAIYLLNESGRDLTTANIATMVGVKAASVTEMLKKLAMQNYIKYSPYHGVMLTKKGEMHAKKVIRKHMLLEIFLKNILKLEYNEVCRQASALEHSLSDTADQQLCVFLDRPYKGPVDKGEIPHCTKKISCEKCLKSYSKASINLMD